MKSKISKKDKKDWEEFLSNKEPLQDKDSYKVQTSINKSFNFDLHGYSLQDANKKIHELIIQAYEKKIKKLVIVTGKGLHSNNDKDPYVSKNLGILKYSVPEYIRNNHELMSMVSAIEDADIKDGGGGAFYIYLKKKL